MITLLFSSVPVDSLLQTLQIRQNKLECNSVPTFDFCWEMLVRNEQAGAGGCSHGWWLRPALAGQVTGVGSSPQLLTPVTSPHSEKSTVSSRPRASLWTRLHRRHRWGAVTDFLFWADYNCQWRKCRSLSSELFFGVRQNGFKTLSVTKEMHQKWK